MVNAGIMRLTTEQVKNMNKELQKTVENIVNEIQRRIDIRNRIADIERLSFIKILERLPDAK